MAKQKTLYAEEMLTRLKALRKKKNLKEEHVARHLGVDKITYIGKENGLIPVTVKEWLKLADVMDVKLIYFLKD